MEKQHGHVSRCNATVEEFCRMLMVELSEYKKFGIYQIQTPLHEPSGMETDFDAPTHVECKSVKYKGPKGIEYVVYVWYEIPWEVEESDPDPVFIKFKFTTHIPLGLMINVEFDIPKTIYEISFAQIVTANRKDVFRRQAALPNNVAVGTLERKGLLRYTDVFAE